MKSAGIPVLCVGQGQLLHSTAVSEHLGSLHCSTTELWQKPLEQFPSLW